MQTKNSEDKPTWETLLTAIPALKAEDGTREGLIETPQRFLRYWNEILAGYEQDPAKILSKKFEIDPVETAAPRQSLQLIRDIHFSSMCEHHLALMQGTIDIAYWAQDTVIGLSKFARLVDCFALRLQIQERLTSQIAEAIWTHTKPRGVFVRCRAQHGCCTGRGVKRQSMDFVTTTALGEINWTELGLTLDMKD